MSLLSFARKISGRQGKKAAVEKNNWQKSTAFEATTTTKIEETIVHTGALGLEPLITEESVTMHGNRQTIAFRVRPDASKGAISMAVKQRFGIDPISIRTLQVRGRLHRRGQSEGRSKMWKKAFVVLPAGRTIDLYAS